LRRPTAVKVLDGAEADKASIARFEREVQVASALTHPNTVEIFDYGRTPDDIFFYAMEYLPGLTLEQLVRSEGAIPPARVLHILRQVLGSLAEAHRLGLIHRDIKPANVILCERGGVLDYVKVVDFGLAKNPESHLSPSITQTGLISGTPLYIAPETIDDPDHLTSRADIYAVGAVAFYLLTGKELFAAANKLEIFDAVMNKPRRRPSDLVPEGIPPELDELVYRAVAIDPADRPASAEEMLAAVEAMAIDYPWSDRDAQRWWQAYEARQTQVAMQPVGLG
jgi:serine/threonine-protein kinase